MNSLRNLALQRAAIPLVADDILEFHAARLLLLLRLGGTKDRVDGLTKLAKLDFFIRYPQFFGRVSAHVSKEESPPAATVESSMVRHRYGPWDKRYYHILAYLEGKNLIDVQKSGSAFQFQLTELGKQAANTLKDKDAFKTLVTQIKAVKRELGGKSGTALKKLIYEVFNKEVADKALGEAIG